MFLLFLSLTRFRNRVPTYSLVQWESQNSVVLLENDCLLIDFKRKDKSSFLKEKTRLTSTRCNKEQRTTHQREGGFENTASTQVEKSKTLEIEEKASQL